MRSDRLPTRLARLLALVAGLLVAASAAAEEPSLSANDLVELRVMDWDPVEGVVRDWPAMAGEYRVRPDGTLDLPFIAAVPAAGRTPTEVAQDVAQALREEFALTEAPDATITLDGYRPVVVAGQVREPGEVLFSPGMTVRHAIALAGGVDPALRQGTDAFREMVETEGNLRLLALERMRLQVRLARLRAERSGAEEIEPPEDLSGPRVERLLADEAEIMALRREGLASERAALNEQMELLETEISSLEQKLESLERQRELAEQSSESVSELANEGLVVNRQILESERSLISIQNQVLDTSTALLRARQGLAAAERELDELDGEWRTDVIDRIIEVESDLVDAEQRIETTARLADVDEIRLAEIIHGGLVSAPRTEPTYRIYRLDGTEIAAEAATPLRPGDLVEMTLPGGEPSTALAEAVQGEIEARRDAAPEEAATD